MKNNHFVLFIYSILALGIYSCVSPKKTITSPVNDISFEFPHIEDFKEYYDSDEQKKWVDSVYQSLNFDERLGQLFMVSAYSNKDSSHTKFIEKLIVEQKIGGLIFFQGGPIRQAKLTNRYQALAKVPLLLGIDGEWGLSMRLDSTYRYPWNMTLGAIKDKSFIEKMGVQLAQQSKSLGIHFNFAPVLDINTNPKNPIIGFRSFGEDKYNVTESAMALMKGYQSLGLLATGKHFPGHGDTAIDSHSALPTITFSRERLNEIELYPYKKLIDAGLSSVMVAHLNVPSLEWRENLPSSVSHNIITDVLKNQLQFKGLIFTDALNMKAAKNFREPGQIDLEAFMAGNDILLCAEDVPVAKEKICMAYQNGFISEERLAYSVKKIIKYKYRTGLHTYKPLDLTTVYSDLNKTENDALHYKLYENAITVLRNKESILPIQDLTKEKIAYVKLGDDTNNSFVSTLKKYTQITEVTHENIDSLQVLLKPFTTVIVGYHKSDKAWKKTDLSATELANLQQLAQNNRVILDVFAKPYTLLPFANFDDFEGLVMSYQNSDIAQEVSAELIFGAIEAKGKLPVTVHPDLPVNFGLSTPKLNRLGFSSPENVGLNPQKLNEIEPVMQKAIAGKIIPGGQILVARKGKVVYQKSFGTQTYAPDSPKINNENLYDIASLSKIIGTLPVFMQIYEQKKLNLDTELGALLPEFSSSNKAHITIKELLSHQAQLPAWEPFYKNTLDSLKKPLETYYSKLYSPTHAFQVADSLFIRSDYPPTILNYIISCKLNPKKEYKYSDFTFIILKEYLEKTSSKTLDELTQQQFFTSIGMNNTLYNPLKKFTPSILVPTEIDTYFRHQLLQGYVHDMTAALQGGVAGHAGLFSNALDVAKMMQLYLQKGQYGNQSYFSTNTFDMFNRCYYLDQGNRRGLGFDKPQLPGTTGPTCGCTSSSSFGHTGFTGTMTWADPDKELIYVFLSNRTYPDATDNKLAKENIREQIQKIIYDAIQPD
ncbi:MAG: beta-N-acetylglucosaminidase [Flavobacterium sp.]|nr:beta-N-acetylglucosaminidase [Flavobacterium sp.]